MYKKQGFEGNKYIYNQMIRTYATACSLDFTPDEVKDMYIQDSWQIFEEARKSNEISVNVINSMLLVYSKCYKKDEIEVIFNYLKKKIKF